MTEALSTQFDFIDNLYTALIARPALAGVYVVSGVVDPNNAPKPDVLSIHGTFADDDFNQIGRGAIVERYTAEGMVIVIRPGSGQTAIKTARDRARAILVELWTVVRTTETLLGSASGWYRPNSLQIQQAYGDGQLCVVNWTLTVNAEIRLS